MSLYRIWHELEIPDRKRRSAKHRRYPTRRAWTSLFRVGKHRKEL